MPTAIATNYLTPPPIPFQYATTNLAIDPLTRREYEVLRWVEAGLSTQEMAVQLGITPGTVKKHIATIFGKLGVSRRTQAVAVAKKLALL